MLCQGCHKNSATVRYAEVVDGNVTDINLCPECAARRRDSDLGGFEFNDPTPTGTKVDLSVLREKPVPKEACGSCGTSLATIMKTGKVGCSACYSSFPAQLESILEGIHTSLIHRGKTLQVDDSRARVRSELQAKRALLKTALSVENYEEAAALRDEIQTLEAGLGMTEAKVP